MSTSRLVGVGCIGLAIAATAVFLMARSGGDGQQLAILPNEPGEQAAQHSDQTAIEGEWQVAAMQRDGEKVAVKDDLRYVFARGVLVVHSGSKPAAQIKYVLSPVGNPKGIEMTCEMAGRALVSPMAYELEGGVLRICYPVPGDPQPVAVAVATTRGDHRTLVELTRRNAVTAAKAPAAPQLTLAKAEPFPRNAEEARPAPTEKETPSREFVTTGQLRPGQVPTGTARQQGFQSSRLPRTVRRDYTIQPRQTIGFDSQACDQARYQAERAVRQYQQQTSGYLGANGLIWSR